MQDGVDISVVVSTHNRADVLGPALRALLFDQRAGDVTYEVILVDNNSTDNTAEVVATLQEGTPVPLRYVFEPRQGVSYGRNAGICASAAPIVAFTDDDIRVAPDWVATVKRTLDEHLDIDCIGGPVLPIWAAPPPAWLDRRHWSPLSVTDYGGKLFEIDASRPRCLLTSNLAMRREVFSRIDRFSPAFPRGQDHELQLRYWMSGGRALYVADLVVYTIVPPERMRKSYHRQWHSRHGRICARMRLRELEAPDGGLRTEPINGRRLLGVPLFLFRDLHAEVKAGLLAVARRDRAGIFAHELAVRHLLNYMSERRREQKASRAPSPARLRRSRRFIPYLAILGLVLGSAYDVATDQEHWPFSQYPMFSQVEHEWRHRTLRLFGVADRAEFPMLDSAYLAPFDQCRFSTALLKISAQQAADDRLHAALKDSLVRYEMQRLEGRHTGPALQAVRLYRLSWTLDPDARNADHPDGRELIAEYRAGEQ